MNYKIKSLIYLSCFIIAALVYNETEKTNQNQDMVIHTVKPQTDNTVSSLTIVKDQI